MVSPRFENNSDSRTSEGGLAPAARLISLIDTGLGTEPIVGSGSETAARARDGPSRNSDDDVSSSHVASCIRERADDVGCGGRSGVDVLCMDTSSVESRLFLQKKVDPAHG